MVEEPRVTGDGRGDHLVDGLRAAKLLEREPFRVDVLKMPHHASDRNVTSDFFDIVTTETYIT